MQSFRLITLLSAMTAYAPCCAFGAEAPKLLPFQGRLTDANGTLVTDGARIVQFKMYDAPVGGQSIWSGEVQKLTVNAGMISTLLGSKASLANIDFNRSLYLEITFDANSDGQISATDPPLLPRQSILPAIFAKESAEARHAVRASKADDAQTIAGHSWEEVELLQAQVRQLEERLSALQAQFDQSQSLLSSRIANLESKTAALSVNDGHLIVSHGPNDTVFQADGNLAQYERGVRLLWHLLGNIADIGSLKAKTRLWSENGDVIHYTPREYMTWQHDGNVVIYRDGPNAIWSSGTHR